MISLLLALTLSAAEKPAVSVLYFDNLTGDPAYDVLRKGLADMMVTDLVAWDGVTVLERERLESVLTELKLQQAKSFDATTTAKVGKLIGAQFIITGTLAADGPTALRVEAKVLKVATGEVVATARIADQRDRIFDLEQRLIEQLTEQLDVRIAKRTARKRAFVPSMSVLLAYSKGLELADQGKLDDANRVFSELVSKNPLVTMARETRVSLLKKLEAAKVKGADITEASLVELGRRAEAALPALVGDDAATRDARVAWLEVRSALLQRALIAQCSSREARTHMVLPGKEAAAAKLSHELYENELHLLAEVFAAGDQLNPALTEPAVQVLLKDAHLEDLRVNATSMLRRVRDLLINGRSVTHDGEVFPTVAVLEPRRVDDLLTLLEQRIVDQKRRWDATPPERRARTEFEFIDALIQKGELLDLLERDEDAAIAYQAVLDQFPTRDNSWLEKRIKVLAGVEYENARENRRRWQDGLRTCDDIDLRVGLGAVRHFEHMGLAGLDALATAVETPCLGRPGMDSTWGYIYGHLASQALRHGDCVRARKFFLKQFTWGVGPRSLAAPNINSTYCNFDFNEDTLPTKVRLGGFHGGGSDQLRSANRALPELLAEELGARGIPIESAGTSHGGVYGIYGGIEGDQRTLKLRYDRLNPATESSTTITDALDVNALLAPLLKVMRPGTDIGPRKASPKLPLDLLVGYGEALELKPEEAQTAFEALAKKYPQFRMIRVRADMAAAKASMERARKEPQ